MDDDLVVLQRHVALGGDRPELLPVALVRRHLPVRVRLLVEEGRQALRRKVAHIREAGVLGDSLHIREQIGRLRPDFDIRAAQPFCVNCPLLRLHAPGLRVGLLRRHAPDAVRKQFEFTAVCPFVRRSPIHYVPKNSASSK